MDFLATNNEAEYEALLVGMAMVQKMGGRIVEVFLDSRLVVGQVRGELKARDISMQEYLSQVKHLQLGFESFNLLQILRSKNTHADFLATFATSSAQSLHRVILVEDLCKPTEMKRKMVCIHQIRVRPSWMDSIVLFLKEDVLPERKIEDQKLYKRSFSEDQKLYKRSFSEDQKLYKCSFSEDQKLYKRSFSRPYLLCIHPEAVELLLEELHEGICGSHIEGRSLSHKSLTLRYWWPNMQKEVQEYVKKCDQCQKFAPNIHQLRGVLNPLSSS